MDLKRGEISYAIFLMSILTSHAGQLVGYELTEVEYVYCEASFQCHYVNTLKIMLSGMAIVVNVVVPRP